MKGEHFNKYFIWLQLHNIKVKQKNHPVIAKINRCKIMTNKSSSYLNRIKEINDTKGKGRRNKK